MTRWSLVVLCVKQIAMFINSTAAIPKVVSERGLARKHVFSKPFKVHQLKKEPSKRYLSSCQFCVGWISDQLEWEHSDLSRHSSLHHRTCTMSLEPLKLNNITGPSHEDAGFVDGHSGLHAPPTGFQLRIVFLI